MNNLAISKRFDGVQFIARDWSFLRQVGAVTFLKNSLTIKFTDSKKDFKGSRLLHGFHKYFHITLGFINNQSIVHIVALPELDAHVKLELEDMRQAVISSMEFALSNLDLVKSRTKQIFVAHCNTIEKFFRKCQLCGSKTRQILNDELYDLGKMFVTELKRNIDAKIQAQLLEDDAIFDGTEVFVTNSALGQDTENFLELKNRFKIVDLTGVSEVLLHVATDYEIPQQCILWNKQQLVEKLDLSNPYDEYYPLMINGRGNFYFDTSHDDESDDDKITVVKFYSELFKNVHKTAKNKPFKESRIAKSLLSQQLSQDEIESYRDLISMLEQHVEIFRIKRSSSARMELIISCQNPSELRVTDLIGAPEGFVKTNSGVPPFEAHPFCKVDDQLKLTLEPALRQLKEALEWKSQISKMEFAFPQIDMLMKAVIAECVAGFVIYGRSYYKNMKKDDQLVSKALGLDRYKSKFKYIPGGRFGWSFDDFKDTQITLDHLLKNEMGLSFNTEDTTLFFKLVDKLCKQTDPLQMDSLGFEDLCKLLMDKMQEFTLSEVFRSSGVASDKRTKLELKSFVFSNREIDPVFVPSFFHWLNRNKTNKFKALGRIFHYLTSKFSNDKHAKFWELFEIYFEDQLYRNGMEFFFVSPTTVKVILPFFITQNFDFDILGYETFASTLEDYKTVLRKLIPHNAVDNIRDADFSESLKDMQKVKGAIRRRTENPQCLASRIFLKKYPFPTLT